MSSTSNYSLSSTPCLPGRNVQFSNIHICEDGEVDGNLEVNTINHLPYPPGGGFLPIPVANKILRTNNLSVISWGDVNPSNLTGGAVGDVLKTVAPGTVAWDPVKPVDITPGTSLQILHTKLDGTAAEWTSSLDVPSNFTVAGSSTFDSNVVCDQTLNVNGNTFCNDSLSVTNDIAISAGNLVVDVGSLTVTTGASALQDVNIAGNLQFNAVSGTSGQYLKKTGAATQAFATLVPGDITAGSANQFLVTNIAGTLPIWTSNPIVPGALNILGDLQLNSSSGSAGQYLKKTGAATQDWQTLSLSIADIAPGTANQLLVTNAGATAATWTSNPVVPSSLNVLGNLQMNSVSGTSGQYLKKTGAATQAFTSLVAADITGGATNQSLFVLGTTPTWTNNTWRYGWFSAPFQAIDWNSGATTAVTFGANTVGSSQYGVVPYNNLTVQLANTNVRCNFTAAYMFSMFCCLTNGGILPVTIRFNTLVGGVITGPGPLITVPAGETGTISCSFPLSLGNSNLVTFRSTRISGSDTLTADATNSAFTFQAMTTIN